MSDIDVTLADGGSDVYAAATNVPQIIPAFTVEKLDGERDHTIHGWDSKGNRVLKTVKEPAGWLVKFPRKHASGKPHSIRVRTAAELKRLGFDRAVPLISTDANDDRVFGTLPASSAAGTRSR